MLWGKQGVLLFSIIVFALTAGFFVVMSYSLYSDTVSILDDKQKEQLKTMVAAAALQFDPSKLEKIQDSSAVGTENYKKTVFQLQNIKGVNEHIIFIYLLRPTPNKNIFKFIADAASLDPSIVADFNGDGKIDEADQLSWPGDEYDASDVPKLVSEGVNFPSTDDEAIVDQWGTLISAYAPIKHAGKTVAVLGLDVDVSNYLALITKTATPFVFFTILLVCTLLVSTIFLVILWRSKVNLLEELDLQKDELLGLVSHQLAAPISAIRWYIEMLLDGDLGEMTQQQKEQLRTVEGSTQNLNDLVSMILDVSRVQLGRVHIEKQKMDLNEFFKEIISVVEPKALEKKVEFIKLLPESFPKAMLDKRYTRMTIENLMTNAIKYTPEKGKVVVTVTTENNILRVVVKDNGFGIPLADQKKIFGKMFRASNVRNSAVDGNGFGLYVAKGAVESQGGKIWFESTEGRGTTFYVELPLE
jgi:signal transduction histidine kinase